MTLNVRFEVPRQSHRFLPLAGTPWVTYLGSRDANYYQLSQCEAATTNILFRMPTRISKRALRSVRGRGGRCRLA